VAAEVAAEEEMNLSQKSKYKNLNSDSSVVVEAVALATEHAAAVVEEWVVAQEEDGGLNEWFFQRLQSETKQNQLNEEIECT
jgi:hypothetical protein